MPSDASPSLWWKSRCAVIWTKVKGSARKVKAAIFRLYLLFIRYLLEDKDLLSAHDK